MRNKIALYALLILICSLCEAQWISINPGAGGQVQDIICDPNQKGRLLLASDMEGIYESVDDGNSWHPIGVLHHNRVFSISLSPVDENKLYVGTLYGLEVSEDGGETFRLIPKTKGKSVSVIAVNSKNPNIVLAGVGWKDDYDFTDSFNLPQMAIGEIYKSTDAGKTWGLINFDKDITTDRNIFTIQFDPVSENDVYLGTGKGIFKSNDLGDTWNKLKDPDGTKRNQGVTISPDGKVLYAAYQKNGNNGSLYTTLKSSVDWEEIIYGNGDVILGNYNYWYPEVDPRSTENTHVITVPFITNREGLFEGTFHWKNNKLTSYEWHNIWYGKKGYDNGWDNAPPNPRIAHYTPASWDRAIWSTTNQTMFKGIPNEKSQGYSWENKYSKPNSKFLVEHNGETFSTYESRGTESTYTYDLAVNKNYVVQGMGDNGAVESWDNGNSWSNVKHRRVSPPLSDVQAIDIANVDDVPIVIAQMTSGYGGYGLGGNLFIKKLIHHSPKDEWLFLAGGEDEIGGLPNSVYREIAVSPVKKNRVFVYANDHGLYMIDDLGKAIEQVSQNEAPTIKKISNGITDGIYSVKKIAPHPTNPDIVFMNGARGEKEGVYKGVNIKGTWNWSKVYEGSSWDAEVVTWENEGQVYLFYSGVSKEKQNDGANYVGALSMDEGKTWQTIFTREKAMKINSHDWYPEISDIFSFANKGGAAGYKNIIIMSYYDHKMQQTYGVYKGTIQSDGRVEWENFTDNLHFGGLTSTVIAMQNGIPYVFVSTAGAGAWKRPL